jgi:sugar/nucleoside kinase (ribokinase family)
MICVVGALAVDLLIRKDRFRRGTSNPASIRFSPGGVGYRIYSHLDGQKMLFTALGSDMFGRWLIENIEQPQWVNPIFLDQYNTACYCALMQSGNLLYGAADMTVIEEGLSWERLRARLPELGAGDFLVLEANLAPPLVRSLIRHAGKKTRVVFESVSVEKLLRHGENLKDLYLLSGNEAELRALGEGCAGGGADTGRTQSTAGAGSTSASGPYGWVQDFLAERNIQQLLVTRGRRGVRLYERDAGDGESEKVRSLTVSPSRIVEMADTTGAGDTLLSMYLEALDREAKVEPALQRAVQIVETCIEEGTL